MFAISPLSVEFEYSPTPGDDEHDCAHERTPLVSPDPPRNLPPGPRNLLPEFSDRAVASPLMAVANLDSGISAFADRFPPDEGLRDWARGLGAVTVNAPRQHGPSPIDLNALLDAYLGLVPAECRTDHVRTLSVMQALVDMKVDPSELKVLVDRGMQRDGWRSLVTAELVYALSFCAANLVPLLLPNAQLLDARDYGASAMDLVSGLNATFSFALAAGIIAVGAEGAQAIVRVGKMGPRYNVAAVASQGRFIPYAESDRGQRVQGFSAWPFGVAYATDDILRDRFQTSPGWRLMFGAGAAAMAAVFRTRCAQASVERLDPAWLDASKPEKREAMEKAVKDLRQGSVRASCGYVLNNLVPGAAASLRETISEKGAVRMGVRLVAASLARSGTMAMHATGTDRQLLAKLASDAWLGLSWGFLSTWPLRVLDRAALGRSQEPGAPVSVPPAVQAVAPPARPVPDPTLSP